MATIHDLSNKDISQMTDVELQQLVTHIRSRRRNPDPEMKQFAKKKAISKKNESVALKSMDSMLKGLTPEQASVLLNQLKGVK